MKIATLRTLTLLVAVAGAHCNAIAAEAITGWGKARFGMTQDQVLALTQNGKYMEKWQLDRFHGEKFAAIIQDDGVEAAGLKWNVEYYFPSGDSKLSLIELEVREASPDIYEQLKVQLEKKYGNGDETTTPHPFAENCRKALERFGDVAHPINYMFRSQPTRSYLIQTKNAFVQVMHDYSELCPETPSHIKRELSADKRQSHLISVYYGMRTVVDGSGL